MQLEYILQNIYGYPVYSSLILVAVLVVIIMFLHLRKDSEEFRKSKMNEKRTKKRILEEIKKNLDGIKDQLSKLVNQKQVVGTFNPNTVTGALRFI
jgi:hypothetical protein